MIPFQKLELDEKSRYEEYLFRADKQACEYSFTNLFLWGRQKAAVQDGFLLLQSQYDRKSVYPFPVGKGDVKAALDAIIHDAAMRGIPCCLAVMSDEDCELVERLYPGKFRFYSERNNYDYIYSIDDLADLKGRKFQKKRNHLNRFAQNHPNAEILPLNEDTRVAAFMLAEQWYQNRCAADPDQDYHLEHLALHRAFAFWEQLGMEGVVLMEDGKPMAFAMGSRLNGDTFDIHFEKALDIYDGAYAFINCGFARYLRQKYPEVKWLNREDDLGIEGLRKAKLSYCPDHMVEKHWARLWEEEDDY